MIYLLRNLGPRITPPEIRGILDLRTTEFDELLRGIIAHFDALSPFPLGTRVWAVQRIKDRPVREFLSEVRRLNGVTRIGPASWLHLNPVDARGPYHEVTCEPKVDWLQSARVRIAAIAMDDGGIAQQIHRERDQLARRPVMDWALSFGRHAENRPHFSGTDPIDDAARAFVESA